MRESCIVSSSNSQKPFVQYPWAAIGFLPATPTTSANVTSVRRHAITNAFGTHLALHRATAFTALARNGSGGRVLGSKQRDTTIGGVSVVSKVVGSSDVAVADIQD